MSGIRWRLTLRTALALLVMVGVAAAAIVLILGISVPDIVENSTRQRVNDAARILATTGTLDSLDQQESDKDIALVAFDAAGAVVFRDGRDNSILDGYPGAVAYQTLHEAGQTGNPQLTYDSEHYDDDPRLRESIDESYVYAVIAPANSLGIAIIAGTRSYDFVGGGRFGTIVVGFSAVFIGLVVIAVVFTSMNLRAALRPIVSFGATANELSGRNLTQRLPIRTRRRDEFDGLAATINAMLDRLQAAFRDREVALEEQRQFVQDASHELRTPLTSILGYTRMLSRWGLEDPATAHEAVRAIEREAERMNALVERLLTLARGDAESFLTVQEVDLREVIRSSVASIAAAQNGKVRLEVGLPHNPVPISIERDLVQQSLLILLDNAVKFTPAGGRVDVSLVQPTAGKVRVVVRDTGIGIAPEDLPKVFDRFYRAERSRTQPGAGLGLAIAQQIATRHGGRIETASTPGAGSTFTLILPLGTHDLGSAPSPLALQAVNAN